MDQLKRNDSTTGTMSPNDMIEHIYHEWDKALSQNDMDALLALYAQDAILESPLVAHILNQERGVCHGHKELKPLFRILATRKPKVRQFYRTDYLTDGKRFMWEYPRKTPKGDQMDFVEVMELNDEGLIQYHRVYWGWYGFGVLQRNEYHQ
jgi:hypothetical protein